ncbi:hypothetical protein, partial [Neisseria bacilliformis]|uniref:hypothetical protein n=1 Tax=Neisseria bacilliformis TaxID=267212 RepID=UPI003C71517B
FQTAFCTDNTNAADKAGCAARNSARGFRRPEWQRTRTACHANSGTDVSVIVDTDKKYSV